MKDQGGRKRFFIEMPTSETKFFQNKTLLKISFYKTTLIYEMQCVLGVKGLDKRSKFWRENDASEL